MYLLALISFPEQPVLLTLRAGYDPPTIQRNINTRNSLVMPLQFIFELESIACSSVQLHAGISCHGQCLPVGGEGVVGNRVVKELVDFWWSHCR